MTTDTRITLETEEMKTAIKKLIITAEKQNMIQEKFTGQNNRNSDNRNDSRPNKVDDKLP